MFFNTLKKLTFFLGVKEQVPLSYRALSTQNPGSRAQQITCISLLFTVQALLKLAQSMQQCQILCIKIFILLGIFKTSFEGLLQI